MKKSILTVGLIAFSQSISAQIYTGRDSDVMLNRVNTQDREPIDGSVYFHNNNNFERARINGGTETFNIRYNALKDIMEYSEVKDSYIELYKDKNTKVDFVSGETFELKTYPFKKNEETGYLQLWSKGTTPIYKRSRKYLQAASAQTDSYGGVRKQAEYKSEKANYFIEKDGKLIPFDKIKDIIALFPSKEKEAKTYLKNNKVSLERRDELEKLINFLNN
ncbi:hypothetical protein AB4865_00490 [Capnocytophaga sp. ARDL2]|uniref:hypothetical protein n=1 Tax=Capnocytophaga sp. ARDL2 TaxID=3238809 RepID=UPI0035581706